MNRRAPPPPVAPGRLLWLVWKLVVALSVALCLIALLRLHSVYRLDARQTRRSRISLNIFDGPPKIAFLFIARKDLPLDFLWGTFFKNADVARFSIFVHSAPRFVLDESTSRSHYFYGRQLNNSIQVLWGEASMIEAERLLLDKALEDSANQRFIFLSDSCVPLYNFSYIYTYLMASPRSFVDSFREEERYHPKMSPTIPKYNWRKGSQWIAVIRSHAEAIADDDLAFPVFKKLCKRNPPLDDIASIRKLKLGSQALHNCIPDEHYVQTLFAIRGLEDELERRTLTYALWNESTSGKERSWHPATFSYRDADPTRIKEIKDIDHILYETEHRTEWCHNNSTSVPCFLFARKFSRGAAMRLLRQGTVGPFDASILLDPAQ